MKLWQVIYLIATGFSFAIGWYFAPILAVAFVWAFIIICEVAHYRRELKEFREEVEKTEESSEV